MLQQCFSIRYTSYTQIVNKEEWQKNNICFNIFQKIQNLPKTAIFLIKTPDILKYEIGFFPKN